MIEIEIKNDEVSKALARLQGALTDMTPVMQDLGEYFVDSTRRRFISGVAPDGTAWAPKSETTKEAYRRRGDKVDDRPLFGPSGALSGGISYRAGADNLAWGSSRIYAGVMQFGGEQGAFGRSSRGGPIPWGNIPARPFLRISAADEEAVLADLTDWLESAATGT